MTTLGTRLVASTALSIGLAAGTAFGQDLPGGMVGLQTQGQSFNWVAGQDGNLEWTEDGYAFSGNDSGSGWIVQWDILASGASTEFITASFTIINTGASAAAFELSAMDMILGDYSTGSLVGGSVAGSYTDFNGNGVTVGSIDGGSIYSAIVDSDTIDPLDGTVVGTLLTATSGSASSFLSGTFASESFGGVPAIPGASGPPVFENIGMNLAFELSAGDSATFTASMAIATPAPGAMALLAITGIHGRRRRTE